MGVTPAAEEGGVSRPEGVPDLQGGVAGDRKADGLGWIRGLARGAAKQRINRG